MLCGVDLHVLNDGHIGIDHLEIDRPQTDDGEEKDEEDEEEEEEEEGEGTAEKKTRKRSSSAKSDTGLPNSDAEQYEESEQSPHKRQRSVK